MKIDPASVIAWCDEIESVISLDMPNNTSYCDPRRPVLAPILAYSLRLLRAVTKELEEARKT